MSPHPTLAPQRPDDIEEGCVWLCSHIRRPLLVRGHQAARESVCAGPLRVGNLEVVLFLTPPTTSLGQPVAQGNQKGGRAFALAPFAIGSLTA